MTDQADVCILVSAGAEWRALLPRYPGARLEPSPYREYFSQSISGFDVVFIHGGWGKVAAAGSTQYAIDRWHPKQIINLGTCGGFEGKVHRGDVILADKTIIYDIFEQMTDPQQAIERYTVTMDCSWLPVSPPQPVTVATILSADRDIVPEDIPGLIDRFDAAVADWESGAIAWVANRNKLPCLILRAVSDLVNPHGGEAYNKYGFFEAQCQSIMADFAHHLPQWLELFQRA